MQQGGMPNIQEYIRQRAKLNSMPEIERLWSFNNAPPEQEQQRGQHERQLAGGKQGEYIHRSVSGSPGTEDSAIQQMMAASQSGGEGM